MTVRVVFDTNILISALLSMTGAPFRCLALARKQVVQSVTCEQILAEFGEKLQQKFRFEEERAREAVEEVRQFSVMVIVPESLHGAVAGDPDDDVVLECAIVGDALFVVTGDKHLLNLRSYRSIAIVRAQVLLDTVAESDS